MQEASNFSSAGEGGGVERGASGILVRSRGVQLLFLPSPCFSIIAQNPDTPAFENACLLCKDPSDILEVHTCANK